MVVGAKKKRCAGLHGEYTTKYSLIRTITYALRTTELGDDKSIHTEGGEHAILDTRLPSLVPKKSLHLVRTGGASPAFSAFGHASDCSMSHHRPSHPKETGDRTPLVQVSLQVELPSHRRSHVVDLVHLQKRGMVGRGGV